MVEFLIIVGVVALAALLSFAAFGQNVSSVTRKEGQCVQSMSSCGDGGNFPGASVDSGSGSDSGSRSGWDKAASFGKGVVVDGLWGAVKGIGHLAWNVATKGPTQAGYEMGQGIAAAWQNRAVIGQSIKQAWKDDPYRVAGRGVFEVATLVVPAAKASLAGRAAEAAEVASTAGKAAEAANAATKTGEAAGAAGKAGEGAKVADNATDGARAAEEACAGGTCGIPGGNCFGPGTPVMTPEGEKPIETIAVGDLVLARDPETGITMPRRVEQLFITSNREVLDVGLERQDGGVEHLTVTPEHPFWLDGRGFVPVGSVNPGDSVATATGHARVVSLLSLPNRITVYNFEVDTAHTYFVGKSATWVHNACGQTAAEAKAAADAKLREASTFTKAKPPQHPPGNGFKWVYDERADRYWIKPGDAPLGPGERPYTPPGAKPANRGPETQGPTFRNDRWSGKP